MQTSCVLLSSRSQRQRQYRKRQLSQQQSGFSWVIFFIAVSTFTVWSLGVSTCSSALDRQQILAYYRSEADNSAAFASVVLLLEQISAHLQQILPACIAALLLSHRHSHLLTEAESPSSSLQDSAVQTAGAHSADIRRQPPVLHLLRLYSVFVTGSTEEAAAALAAK
jgi:hypothetical protein